MQSNFANSNFDNLNSRNSNSFASPVDKPLLFEFFLRTYFGRLVNSILFYFLKNRKINSKNLEKGYPRGGITCKVLWVRTYRRFYNQRLVGGLSLIVSPPTTEQGSSYFFSKSRIIFPLKAAFLKVKFSSGVRIAGSRSCAHSNKVPRPAYTDNYEV